MGRLIIILFFVFYTFASYAQDDLFSIKGGIHDEANKNLPYASVALKSPLPENKLIKGTLSTEEGHFELGSVKGGVYKLLINMVGYKPYSKDLAVKANIDLGTIQLEIDAAVLGEVKVTANKPLVSRKIDRYVLNVSGSILASGRTTFELLNYAPGVITTGNAISINGNSATKVMVNGRLLRLSADQVQNYLANLRSEDLESIEVIPNPGAEFEAEGSGGLVNIRLKKERAGGFNGTLGLGAVTPIMPSYNTNAQLNYGYKGLQLYASHNYTKREADSYSSDQRSNGALLYNTDITNHSKSDAHNFRTGAGYDFSENHYLGIEFNGNFNKSDINSVSQSLLNDPVNNKYNRITGDFSTKNKNTLYNLSLNYNWKLDTLGSLFSVVADRSTVDREAEGNFFSHYTTLQNVFVLDSIYRNSAPVDIKNYNVAADYVKSFNKKQQLKAGAKFTQTNTGNDVSYDYLVNNQFVNDEQRSNKFEYKERITALYAQYSIEGEKTAVQFGLRGENTDTRGLSVTSGDRTHRSYFNLFPSLFLKRDINKDNSLSFNYGRRLDRPSFNSLNPFEWRIDDYSYIRGNPYLNPQFTNSVKLSYLYKNKYDISIFASRTKGVFGQYLTGEGANDIVANYSWENLNRQYYYGTGIYLPINITKWWGTVNNILLYRNSISFGDVESNKTVFSGKTTQNITLDKDLRVEVSALYQSASNLSNQIFVPNYYVDLGVSKSLYKKKLSARLLLTDVFNTSKMDYSALTGTAFKLDEKQKYTTRRFSVQLTYNFNLGKKVNVQKVEAGNTKEKNRM